MGEVAEDTNWVVESSDEEFQGMQGEVEWEPSVDEMKRMFQILENSKISTLEWKCLGRRLPSPPKNEYTQDDTMNIDDNPNSEEQSDFDFKDELISPQLTRRRPNSECGAQLKGSAKKKTTSLDGILNNMRRHRQLEQLEKESEQTISSQSVTTPSTATPTFVSTTTTPITSANQDE